MKMIILKIIFHALQSREAKKCASSSLETAVQALSLGICSNIRKKIFHSPVRIMCAWQVIVRGLVRPMPERNDRWHNTNNYTRRTAMNNLNYCVFPLAINKLEISSMYELQLLALAGSLPDGLLQSNASLARLLCTHRKTIVQALRRLRLKGLLTNIGSQRQRVLAVQGKAREIFCEYQQSQPTTSSAEQQPDPARPEDSSPKQEPLLQSRLQYQTEQTSLTEGVISTPPIEVASTPAMGVTSSPAMGVISTPPIEVASTPAGGVASPPAEGVISPPAVGGDTTPHNIINIIKEINNKYIYTQQIDLLKKLFGKPLGRFDLDNAQRYLKCKGLDWCVKAIKSNPDCLFLGDCFKKGARQDEQPKSIFGYF